MRHLTRNAAIACLIATGTACAVRTYPGQVRPKDPIRHYSLLVPDSLEVVSVDYDIVIWTDDRRNPPGRAFVKVIARNRGTGAFVLMLYEDIAHRTEPIQTIEVNSANMSSSSGIRE